MAQQLQPQPHFRIGRHSRLQPNPRWTAEGWGDTPLSEKLRHPHWTWLVKDKKHLTDFTELLNVVTGSAKGPWIRRFPPNDLLVNQIPTQVHYPFIDEDGEGGGENPVLSYDTKMAPALSLFWETHGVQFPGQNNNINGNTMIAELAQGYEHYEYILERLQCRVCLDHCFPPIYSCASGHLICGACKETYIRTELRAGAVLGDEVVSGMGVDLGGGGDAQGLGERGPEELGTVTCPTCRKEDLLEHHQTALEMMMSLLTFNCLNRGNGCMVVCPSNKLRSHVDGECLFQRWKCPYCFLFISKDDFEGHWKIKHPHILNFSTSADALGVTFNLPSPIRGTLTIRKPKPRGNPITLGIFKIGDYQFILYELEIVYLKYCWFLGFVGPNEIARKFRVSFRVKTVFTMYLEESFENVVMTEEWPGRNVISCQEEIEPLLTTVREMVNNGGVVYDYSICKTTRAQRFSSRLSITIQEL